MDQGDRSLRRIPRELLEPARLQLVRGNLVERGRYIGHRHNLRRLRHLRVIKESI
jgi:hypothetical protein